MSSSDSVTVQSCDSSASFSVDQGASVTLATNTTDQLEGTGCLSIKAGGAPQLLVIGANCTAFDVEAKNFVTPMNYSKGKTAQFISDLVSGLRLRLYFGGTNPATTPWAEWNQGGNLDLPFGWSPYYASGRTADALGNGHNGGSDYGLDVQRIAVVIDQANNNSGSNDPPFLVDFMHAISVIRMTGGTLGAPLTEADVLAYDAANNLGVVLQDRSQKGLITRCGIEAGDGTTAGFLAFEGLAILNDQLSDEVEQVWRVRSGSGMRLGVLETGVDSTYAVNGCQLSCPPTRNPNFEVDDGATFEAYDTLFFRWGEINVGAVGGTTGSRTLRLVDIDACESLNLNQAGSYTEYELHDNAQRVQQHAGEFLVTPTDSSGLIHNNAEGVHFRETATWRDLVFDDNTSQDFRVLSNTTPTFVNCDFDPGKTAEQTT